jgi:hypothetical protein
VGTVLLQGFIQKLRSYESVLLGTTVTTRLATDMQRLLGVGPYMRPSSQVIGPGSQLKNHLFQENPNAAEWSRLCGLISAYRLLDVIILIEGRVSRSVNSVRRPRERDEKILNVMYLTIGPYFSINFILGHEQTWGLAEGVA